MNKFTYIDHCLNVLAFDNIKPQLSIADRMYLHKERAAAIEAMSDHDIPRNAPPRRVRELGELIKEANWQRPELKYNVERMLEVYDEELLVWKLFIPSEYE